MRKTIGPILNVVEIRLLMTRSGRNLCQSQPLDRCVIRLFPAFRTLKLCDRGRTRVLFLEVICLAAYKICKKLKLFQRDVISLYNCTIAVNVYLSGFQSACFVQNTALVQYFEQNMHSEILTNRHSQRLYNYKGRLHPVETAWAFYKFCRLLSKFGGVPRSRISTSIKWNKFNLAEKIAYFSE